MYLNGYTGNTLAEESKVEVAIHVLSTIRGGAPVDVYYNGSRHQKPQGLHHHLPPWSVSCQDRRRWGLHCWGLHC
jgi:hypothetical protein